jgi:hypothetical protein
MSAPLHSWPRHRLLVAFAIGLGFSSGAGAQIVAPPKPIDAPPVPPPPRLGPVPPVNLGSLDPPPAIGAQIPAPANLVPVAMPPAAPVTPADASDPTRPPQYVMPSGPTAMISPGANESQIQEIALIVNSGEAGIPSAVDAKLNQVAASLKQNPTARLEVRVFSPANESDTQSNARRLSLSRFLAVRDFLVHAGVARSRIDGRPLASKPNELNPDRIELYIEH